MARNVPAPAFSWANESRQGAAGNANRLARAFGSLREFTLFDAAMIVLVLAVYDGVLMLVLTGVQSVQCGGNCGLRSQLDLARQALIMVPPLLILPPLLLATLLRKRRLLVAGFQILVCALLTVHNLSDQHVLHQRLDGTVACWNPAYAPKECPWGVR